MRQISISIASKRRHAELIKGLRLDGVHLNSRWLDTANLASNAAKPAAHWQRENYSDIRSSEAMLVYGEKGETLVNALQEVGYAIAFGLPVFCVGSPATGAEAEAHGPGTFWHPDYQPWAASRPPGGIYMARDFPTAFRMVRALVEGTPLVAEPGLTQAQQAMAQRNGKQELAGP